MATAVTKRPSRGVKETENPTPTNFSGLLPKQELVALAIASGSTLEQAARKANVGVSTIRNWTVDCADFVERIQAIRDEISRAVIDKLKLGMMEATDMFRELVREGETSHIRMKAGEALMVHGIAITEMLDLKQRIAILEGGKGPQNVVMVNAVAKSETGQ